jgi:predicted  nucleic acid-binding Zn-ribbon protein
MALSSRICPDCGQRYRSAPATTITGRKVCPDCAQALFMSIAAALPPRPKPRPARPAPTGAANPRATANPQAAADPSAATAAEDLSPDCAASRSRWRLRGTAR